MKMPPFIDTLQTNPFIRQSMTNKNTSEIRLLTLHDRYTEIQTEFSQTGNEWLLTLATI